MSADTRAVHENRTPRFGRLAGAALLLSASFILSRVLGVLRNAAIAHIFGLTWQTEAYFAAFRIPDTLFTLVSGGALASAFVPTFAGLLERDASEEAWKVASTVLNTVLAVLLAMGAVAFVFAPQIMTSLVQEHHAGEQALTVHLARIMLLQPIFLGVAAIFASILQSYRRFALTAVAPLLYNIAVILGAVVFGPVYGIQALSWAVVIGAIANLVTQVPGVRVEFFRYFRLSVDWTSRNAREILRLLGPRVVGLAAFQAMLLITVWLASGLPNNMISAINYSWPLIQFPIGALGTAAGTAIFPDLSRLSATEDWQALRRTVNRSLGIVLFLSLPSAVGLIVLRRPIVNLLYYHGAWVHKDTESTAFALLFYAMAIAPLAAIEVLPRVFYAMKDTLTPVRIAVVAVAIDAGLSVLLVNLLPHTSGQGGLALATAVASAIQALWLMYALNRRIENAKGTLELLRTVRDAGAASLIMGLVLYLALALLTAVLPQHGMGVLITVLVEVGLGIGTFVAVCWALGAPELLVVLKFAARSK